MAINAHGSRQISGGHEALEDLALDTARYFFTVCDRESKGYVCKTDMDRLKEDELCNLSPDDMDLIFDSLDQDKNGILTMDEFIDRFSSFVKANYPEMLNSINNDRRNSELVSSTRDLSRRSSVSQDKFAYFFSQIGGKDAITDRHNAEYLWHALEKHNPALLGNFASLLEGLTNDVKKMHTEMSKYRTNQKEELNSLYAEMDLQMKKESEAQVRREQEKLKKLQWSMEAEIEKTNLQYQELSQKYIAIENQLRDMTYDREKSKTLLDKLRKERDVLAEQKDQLNEDLEKSRCELSELSTYLDKVQREIRDERKRRAVATRNLNEEAINERENLIRQLATLRSDNINLMDELDESVVRRSPQHLLSTSPRQMQNQMDDAHSAGVGVVNAQSIYAEQCGPTILKGDYARERHEVLETEMKMAQDLTEDSGISEAAADVQNATCSLNIGLPDRIFKVVVAGDSGVGKTSFLDRFCNDRFNSSLRTTIGVDFLVKLLKVEDQNIALQLWDTAGQERFRSITKQYFRKADAVILMFDLTSENSFMNVRQWLASVEQVIEPYCVICVIGNKTDLIQEGSVDLRKESMKIDDLNSLYFETSAKTGDSVQEAMYQLSLVLKDINCKEEQKTVRLDVATEKKSRCCRRSTAS